MTNQKAVLNKAIELIEEHGFLKEAWGVEGYGFCTMGAVDRAAVLLDTYWDWTTEYFKFRPFLGKSLITEWNDAPERSKDEVLALLRSVAESV